MSPTDAISARFAPLHPKRIDLSLGRIARLLEGLGAPHKRLPPVVHVAGTNGKGSTVAFLRAALEAAGKRVHAYTSPHLVRFNERIRLAGALVDDGRLAQALDRCEAVNAGQSISVFEITTAAAFLLFSETPADFLLLEVGLGGRFDATNVVDAPAATIITPVSIDHPEFLGATVEEIAYEKAGILRSGAPAIIAEQEEGALRVIEGEALRVGAPRIVAGRDFFVRAEHGRLIFEDRDGLLDLPLPRLPGRHQHRQRCGGDRGAARDRAGHSRSRASNEECWRPTGPRVCSACAADRSSPMRPRSAEVWLDGAHNEAGGRVLAEAMADFEDHSPRPLALICGALATKDTAGFLGHFKGLAQETLAVPIAGEHAGRSAEEVAIARGVGLRRRLRKRRLGALLAARQWQSRRAF